jgi:Type II secretion system (T2SS), protein F
MVVVKPALKTLLLQAWFFFGLPLFGVALVYALRVPGLFLFLLLAVLWVYEWFAYSHYSFCRQQELLQVFKAAEATQSPVEKLLRAYWEDRPRNVGYRFCTSAVMFFVFPGYYWIQIHQGFDARLGRLVALLHDGCPLDKALRLVPGLVSREVALGLSAGRYCSGPAQALGQVSYGRTTSPWLDLAPRFVYPLIILAIMLQNLAFMMVFIVPKFENIFHNFRMRLPPITETFVSASRGFLGYLWVLPLLWLLVLGLLNLLIFSSQAKWYFPVLGRLYRMQLRGEFLQTLGLMLTTGKPLPEILRKLIDSGHLPRALSLRAERLEADLDQGQPLTASLAKRGLTTGSMQGLLEAATKANNLSWALRELGDSSIRRGTMLGQRLAQVLFPLAIFLCACLTAFVAIAMFSPLIRLMEGVAYAN